MKIVKSSRWLLALAAACLWTAGCSDDDDDDNGPAVFNPGPGPSPDPGPDPGPGPGPDPDPDPDPDPTPGMPGWTGQGNGDVQLSSVTAVDADHAWTTSPTGAGLHITVDGGETWTVTDGNYAEIQFVDAQHGFARMSSMLDSSTDGGQTWTPVLNVSGLRAFSFISPTTGWAATESGDLYKTTNAGATWSQTPLPIGVARLSFVDAQTGWIASNGNEGVYKSVDGGTTWTQSHSPTAPTAFTDISTVGASHAWVSGFRGDSGVILATTDGGATWTETGSPAGRAIHFVDATTGWMVNDEVLISEDGGATWTAQEIPDGFWNTGTLGAHFSGFADVFFVNGTTGWVVGDNGVILHTTTAGK